MRPSYEMVATAIGEVGARRWSSYLLHDPMHLAGAIRGLHAEVKPSSGQCAMLSATLASYLSEELMLPAVVVAGDLHAAGRAVFVLGESRLPECTGDVSFQVVEWPGHCWVDVGGYLCDISLFRSAYAVDPSHHLATFVRRQFGGRRGAVIGDPSEMADQGLTYTPRQVLTGDVVAALWAGVGAMKRGWQPAN
jgi:hypothetical protein